MIIDGFNNDFAILGRDEFRAIPSLMEIDFLQFGNLDQIVYWETSISVGPTSSAISWAIIQN